MGSPDSRGAPASTIPQKRAHGDDGQDHIPAVPSPLNPDTAAAKEAVRTAVAPNAANLIGTNGGSTGTGIGKPTPVREQREKKESLKKREANEAGVGSNKAGSAGSGNVGTTSAPDMKEKGRKSGASAKKQQATASPLPLLRYHIPRPKPYDFEAPTPPVPVPGLSVAGKQFFETTEHVFNRKGFRYIHCIADPGFPSIQYHRQSETEPFHTRFDYSDSSQHIHLDQTARCVTTEKGFRMARANVCAREGRWYWECKVLNGMKKPGNAGSGAGGGSNGHVRVGFSRREASLETPVGFDAYSYGLRDASGQKVHMSRPKDFMPEGEEVREGDVIGFEIDLPGLPLHRKVVEGTYNKAVDVSDNVDPAEAGTQDIIRDRLPIRYKSHLYFESFEYQSTKELEDLTHPSPAVTSSGLDKSGSNQAPYPNHPNVSLRTLPNSCIKVYKNGKYMGTPFKDLLAFLPPASKPAGGAGQVSAREGLDDGILGYFPSVSVFRGGAVEANFGPDFWSPPPDLKQAGDDDVAMGDGNSATSAGADGTPGKTGRRRLRAMAERYDEQIAEDTVYDIVDEVDLWLTESTGKQDSSKRAKAPTVLGPVDPAAPGLEAAVADATAVVGESRAGEIKEIVQEDDE